MPLDAESIIEALDTAEALTPELVLEQAQPDLILLTMTTEDLALGKAPGRWKSGTYLSPTQYLGPFRPSNGLPFRRRSASCCPRSSTRGRTASIRWANRPRAL